MSDTAARAGTHNIPHRLWMYQVMVKSRRFEEAILAAYLEGKTPAFNMANGPIPGEMHLSNGQEPCAVGICAHLRPTDMVTATHRPHHVAIAKGVNLNTMTAEIFGKRNGLSGGRGGHMHLFDAAVNFSCTGIVAQGLAPAVGGALAAQLSGRDDVAVAFLGEGAANQGVFHEALNLAAVWKAPVIFVIEDNAYGISVSKSVSTAVERNVVRAAAYDMPGLFVPNNDADLVHEAAATAIARARAGEGPSLIEIETHRLAGHFVGDAEQYRPAGERDAVHACDPIPAYRARLLELGYDCADLDRAEADAAQDVERAISFARSSPDALPDDAFTQIFA